MKIFREIADMVRYYIPSRKKDATPLDLNDPLTKALMECARDLKVLQYHERGLGTPQDNDTREFLQRMNSWVAPEVNRLVELGRNQGEIGEKGGYFRIDDLGPDCYEDSRLDLIYTHLERQGWEVTHDVEKDPPWAFYADHIHHFYLKPKSTNSNIADLVTTH